MKRLGLSIKFTTVVNFLYRLTWRLLTLSFIGLVIPDVLFFCLNSSNLNSAWAKSFKSGQILIIKPRTFTKRLRVETNLSYGYVMNQSFSNNHLAIPKIRFHLSEYFALGGSYLLGSSSKNKDFYVSKEVTNEFERISKHTKSGYSLDLVITPFYGKSAMRSLGIQYYDTYLEFGFGSNQVNHYRSNCGGQSYFQDFTYSTTHIALGEKLFYGRSMALDMSFHYKSYQYPAIDSYCELQNELPEYQYLQLNETTRNGQDAYFSLGFSYFLGKSRGE